MARWEPNARDRLERAALDLFAEHGYERTTVAEIAERAGLTKRTLFRHFTDKREILMSGQDALEEAYVSAIAAAPAGASPLEALAAGLRGAAELVEGRGDLARRRQAVVAASPELQERELLKRATLATSIAAALRARGVGELEAAVLAETAVGVFKVAYARWAPDPAALALPGIVQECLDRLTTMTRLPG